jgi:hypothetical protein
MQRPRLDRDEHGSKVTTPALAVKTKVTWKRPGLPDGVGVIAQIKTVGTLSVYMVRDKRNNLYAFHANDLTVVP